DVADELEQRGLTGGRAAAGPGDLADLDLLALARLVGLALPAGRGGEGVDREALRRRELDLRRGRARLLGRHREREQLARVGEDLGRAERGMSRRAGRERERGDDRRQDEAAHQLTFRVNGAVSTLPFTFAWMKSRQVPATGSSTPISR